jgi:DNA repair photolyase
MARLSEAGIATGISISPMIPGLNDQDIPELLERAREVGAVEAISTPLRLAKSVEAVFIERMSEAFPDRIGKIIHRIREVRGGAMTDGAFFSRQQGQGPYWAMIERLFALAKRKAGFSERDDGSVPDTFRRPGPEQSRLF